MAGVQVVRFRVWHSVFGYYGLGLRVEGLGV